jgi:hypothetical protein
VATTRLPLYGQRIEYVEAPADRWALYGAWAESKLDTYIAALVKDVGGQHHHIPDSRQMGEAGLPDHLCVIPKGGITYLEAKRFDRGKPTLPTVDTFVGGTISGHVRKGQETWFNAIREASGFVFLVYPTDVPDLATILYRQDGYTRTAAWMRMSKWARDGVWILPRGPLRKSNLKA